MSIFDETNMQSDSIQSKYNFFFKFVTKFDSFIIHKRLCLFFFSLEIL